MRERSEKNKLRAKYLGKVSRFFSNSRSKRTVQRSLFSFDYGSAGASRKNCVSACKENEVVLLRPEETT